MSMELDVLLRSWPLSRRRRLLSKDSLRSGTVSVHAFKKSCLKATGTLTFLPGRLPRQPTMHSAA